jgi:hypothetical protein
MFKGSVLLRRIIERRVRVSRQHAVHAAIATVVALGQ